MVQGENIIKNLESIKFIEGGNGMAFWEMGTIPYADLPKNIYYGLDLKEKPKKPQFEQIEYIALYTYRVSQSGSNFYPFEDFPNLLSVDLSFTNIIDFSVFESCTKLKRIELAYCRNLSSFKGISHLSDSLEFLMISNAKKLKLDDELLKLNNLRFLDLNAISSIDDLSFLKHFPKLESLRFFDTNIIDGDLTPIVDHPTLTFVGSYNKRHYNKKLEEVEQLLAEKEKRLSNVSE